MAIYYYVYPSAFQNPGGGEVQLLKTREYLENRGVEIKLYDQWKDQLKQGDILHVFGSVKYCYGLMRTAKEAGAKVALSTICWYDWPSAFFTYPGLNQRVLNILRHSAKVFFPWAPSMRRAMMHLSDLLLPNSEAEANQLIRYFGVPREKIRVVPNGVDPRYQNTSPEPFFNRYGYHNFFLCVGRIEPRKNQLSLIRAHRGIEKSLVIIGEAVSRYTDYADKCRREAADNVHFLGYLPHDSELLRSAYAACDTFILPSWFETPGLAALEAALAGAKVVITTGGATKEYFSDAALYVRPYQISDIHQKMTEALSQPKNGRLRESVLQNFLWEKVAEKLATIYQSLL